MSARVPKEVLERIDQWAEDNNCTRSVAVAKLLEHGLDATAKAQRAKRKAV